MSIKSNNARSSDGEASLVFLVLVFFFLVEVDLFLAGMMVVVFVSKYMCVCLFFFLFCCVCGVCGSERFIESNAYSNKLLSCAVAYWFRW